MKPEVVFGLEGAAWPALLLDTSCMILRANTAAMNVFGAALNAAAAHLSVIWPPGNSGTPEQFFSHWQQSPAPTMELNLRIASGAVAKFMAAICVFGNDGKKWFVLQLLPVPKPAPVQSAPLEMPAESKPVADGGGVALKQKLDCALQLARTVSLDFNNALTSVLGHTSLLLGKAEPGHPWRYSLMEVEKSAGRAAEIANELQMFSRQEKETKRLPPADLNLVTTQCVDFFRKTHGEKIGWKVQLDPNLFGARFDEVKVQQVLTKILENAVEAVGSGGGGQIAVQTRNVDLTEPTQDRNVRLAAGAYISVEIADNGPGIEPDVLLKIFDPFFTTKGKTHRGLGLALAYGIMSNHGGGVAISSQVGAGTSARIYLPAEKQLTRESSSAEENLNGTETILIVDDEGLLLTMGETILTEFGYRVLTANGGQKAMTILSRGDTKVDLVITDLVMPTMSGRELAERIRQLAPAIKIICMSGYVMPTDKLAGTTYLQKPFTSQELLMKVKTVLSAA